MISRMAALPLRGLRFESAGKSIGYATDFNELTDNMRILYQGLDIWVVDALRRAPHPTHPDLRSVLGWVGDLGIRRAALVHMDNSMDYATLAADARPPESSRAMTGWSWCHDD